MPPELAAKIERAVQKILSLGGDRVRFIILYGSASSSGMKSDSDIDIYDIKIFQQLPLPLRMEVLKGRVLYEDGSTFMYDKAYETIKEFESFRRRYYDYLGIESIT